MPGANESQVWELIHRSSSPEGGGTLDVRKVEDGKFTHYSTLRPGESLWWLLLNDDGVSLQSGEFPHPAFDLDWPVEVRACDYCGLPTTHDAAEDKPSWVAEIMAERQRQDVQWGGPDHDDANTSVEWEQCMDRHVGLLSDVDFVPRPGYRERLVKIAALAVAAMQSYDRKAQEG